MSAPRLTGKQRLFVANLVRLNYNQTAALKATYGENPHPKSSPRWEAWEGYARARASELVTKPNVSEAIRLAQRRAIEQAEVTEDMIVAALGAIAFTKLDDVAPWDEDGLRLTPSEELPWRFKAAVRGIKVRRRVVEEDDGGKSYQVEEVEIRMPDKTPALKLLMQHFGMLSKVTVKAEPGSQVNVDARQQSLLVEKLGAMSPEELLDAVMKMPPDPEGD